MNKLKRDIRLRIVSQLVWLASLVGLGIFKLVEVLAGIGEQEFYRRYPAGGWIVVSLGIVFIAALVHSVKKTMDIHPNIQLRSQPDETLEAVLQDPEYSLWHGEARRLLSQRRSVSG